jgi:TonB family protein
MVFVQLLRRWQHREAVASHVKAFSIVALSLLFFFTLPICGQVATITTANTGSRRIKNKAPEAMWKRVTECTFPAYSPLARQVHITGTVDIALLISPEGNLGSYRVLLGHPLLTTSAVDAIRQWKFQPDVVDGDMVWTPVRALVLFNNDGTTAVELARALLPDNFGDPGTTRAEEGRLSRPASAPECKYVQSFAGPQAAEIEVSELSPGFYRNSFFGMSFHFPPDWHVADRETLNLIAANGDKVSQAQFGPIIPANVQMFALPFYLLFFARTDGPVGSAGPSVCIWAEKEPFITSAERYFPNSRFLADKTADGTRGPTAVDVNGKKYYRADRWGKVDDHTIYQVRLVTYTRDLMLGIDVEAETAATTEHLVKSLEGLRVTPGRPTSKNEPDLGTLADRLAHEVKERNKLGVPPKMVVMDFANQDEIPTVLGDHLAELLSNALAERLGPEHIVTHSELRGYLISSGISPFDLQNSEIARWNAENVGTSIVRASATESEQLRATTIN